MYTKIQGNQNFSAKTFQNQKIQFHTLLIMKINCKLWQKKNITSLVLYSSSCFHVVLLSTPQIQVRGQK